MAQRLLGRGAPGEGAVKALSATALTAAMAVASCRPPGLFAGMERHTRWVMGTPLTLAIPALPEGRTETLAREAFAVVASLDDLLSDYKPDSPLSRLTEEAAGRAVAVDERLYVFLQRTLEDARRTGGTFDVTVGALTRAYREGRTDPASLQRARQAIGHHRVQLLAGGRVRLEGSVRLDPGGIGKGYALDAVVALLRAHGVRRAFLDFGGSSFYGLGAPPGRRGWPVLLRAAEPGRVLGVVWLRDAGLSTSLSLPPPDPLKSASRGHIVDPRSGRLVEVARVAAAVSPSATDAEVVTKPLIIDPALRERLHRAYRGTAMLTQEAGKAPVMDGEMRAIFGPAD
jgi:thiamine biosynthesis lipoprotein